MNKQPQFYKLGNFHVANFWTRGDASTRRTLVVPRPHSFEFLAFGVLSPSSELDFVVRGRLEHEKDFLAQMKKAGASVIPMEQTETEDPPPLPKLDVDDTEAQVVLRSASSSDDTVTFSSVQNSLWPTGSQARHVILVPVPGSTEESIAFGLCELVSTNELWEVAFVARMKNADREEFKAALPTSIPVDEYTTPPQTSLRDYLHDCFEVFTAQRVGKDLLKGLASNSARLSRPAA